MPLHVQGSGHADTDNCSCPPCCYNVTVDMDTNTTTFLIEKLQVLHNKTITNIRDHIP